MPTGLVPSKPLGRRQMRLKMLREVATHPIAHPTPRDEWALEILGGPGGTGRFYASGYPSSRRAVAPARIGSSAA
jgi:hypothetical protein